MVEFCILVGFFALLGVMSIIAHLLWKVRPIRRTFCRLTNDLPMMWDWAETLYEHEENAPFVQNGKSEHSTLCHTNVSKNHV